MIVLYPHIVYSSRSNVCGDNIYIVCFKDDFLNSKIIMIVMFQVKGMLFMDKTRCN